MKNGINVVSLCDGMSGGQITLNELGIKVNKYFASEIKDIGIKTTLYNFPNTIEIGDVNKINYKNGILYTEKGDFKENIDLVIFGSPCQSFSIAMKTEHRIGLKDKEKSGLFLECYRILKEINPKFFMMENVASMKNEDRDFISKLMNVNPIRINSKIVSPALRDRYYWTNIPNIKIPNDKNILLQDILTEGYTNRKKAHCLTVVDSRPLTTPLKMFYRYYVKGFTNLIFKNEKHFKDCEEHFNTHYKGMKAKDIDNIMNSIDNSIYNGVRYINQTEMEKCQTVPEGYTKCLTRNESADVLGDGWNIETIKILFTPLKEIYK